MKIGRAQNRQDTLKKKKNTEQEKSSTRNRDLFEAMIIKTMVL